MSHVTVGLISGPGGNNPPPQQPPRPRIGITPDQAPELFALLDINQDGQLSRMKSQTTGIAIFCRSSSLASICRKRPAFPIWRVCPSGITP